MVYCKLALLKQGERHTHDPLEFVLKGGSGAPDGLLDGSRETSAEIRLMRTTAGSKRPICRRNKWPTTSQLRSSGFKNSDRILYNNARKLSPSHLNLATDDVFGHVFCLLMFI
jgi:hypothetical protein